MTDFSAATLSLRELMTAAPPGDARAEALLATRDAVVSSSPLSNPILAVSKLKGWPTSEMLSRLSRGPAQRNVPVEASAYFQLAFPAEAAPSDLPDGVSFLGYDVTDGSDSYLIDYGDMPPPFGVPPDELNAAGLLASLEDATGLAETLRREWGLGADDGPQTWALYRVAALP